MHLRWVVAPPSPFLVHVFHISMLIFLYAWAYAFDKRGACGSVGLCQAKCFL